MKINAQCPHLRSLRIKKLLDWSNLDLIIYYLETNRADTIKEALQLLDEEIRTLVLVRK